MQYLRLSYLEKPVFTLRSERTKALREICQKEGEGTSQRTHMNDPWTWTIMWGLTAGGWTGQGRANRKIGTTVIEKQ